MRPRVATRALWSRMLETPSFKRASLGPLTHLLTRGNIWYHSAEVVFNDTVFRISDHSGWDRYNYIDSDETVWLDIFFPYNYIDSKFAKCRSITSKLSFFFLDASSHLYYKTASFRRQHLCFNGGQNQKLKMNKSEWLYQNNHWNMSQLLFYCKICI